MYYLIKTNDFSDRLVYWFEGAQKHVSCSNSLFNLLLMSKIISTTYLKSLNQKLSIITKKKIMEQTKTDWVCAFLERVNDANAT